MRLTALLAPTLRETPGEAEIASHQLMLRAGLMRKVASGIYTYLPLGHRVISKVERIIREEMDAAGAQELRLPIVQPAELWEETGRWAAYGDEMWRVRDRHGREFCLGPTHEEVITDLVRKEINSYRQLPLTLYQIQNKYRDEMRPRFGVMRAREFIMKDAYSFHRDEACLAETYQRVFDAYTRIFTRCGLDFRAVEADTGAIGGSFTHEFLALADTGEAALVWCGACGYAANVEKAEARRTSAPGVNGDSAGGAAGAGAGLRPERVSTPGVTSIEGLCRLLGVKPEAICKSVFCRAVYDDGREELVCALVRGDHELNEVKLKNFLGALIVEMAGPNLVEESASVPLGFAGPVGLPAGRVRVVADPAVMHAPSLITGANEPDYHLAGVVPGRDFIPDAVTDLRLVTGGDPCPRCGNPLRQQRGIEVGQVFQLGTKYSKAMHATFLDEHGQERLVVMGCYGIGVTRTVAAIIEQHHDEDGIIWPVSVAPYHAVVVPVNWGDDRQRETATSIYMELKSAGIEVCLDDRDERAGVKFKDADLIGFPFRIVVGPKGLASGSAELIERGSRAAEAVPFGGLRSVLQARLEEAERVR